MGQATRGIGPAQIWPGPVSFCGLVRWTKNSDAGRGETGVSNVAFPLRPSSLHSLMVMLKLCRLPSYHFS